MLSNTVQRINKKTCIYKHLHTYCE